MKNGIELIADERQRQQEIEGFTLEHDANYGKDNLAIAGAIYALPQSERDHMTHDGVTTPTGWPFYADWWKPSPHDRIRELVKAGALIAAEIDRLNFMSDSSLTIEQVAQLYGKKVRYQWLSLDGNDWTEKIGLVTATLLKEMEQGSIKEVVEYVLL